MGRANHLTKAEKELISIMYQKSGKSLGAIAKFLDRSNRSVNRYKNYKLPRTVKSTIKPQVKPKIEPEFKVEDQELFKRMYDEFVKYHWFEDSPSDIFKQIKYRHWKEKIAKWPTYKGMYKTDIIIDLRERAIRKYSNEVNQVS